MYNNHRRTRLLFLAATAIGLVSTDAACAQSASAVGSIEEVVVTARKRQESLQDVPIAVSAATGPQLERQGIRSLLDLQRLAPGLRTATNPSAGSTVEFSIRGQSAGNIQTTIDTAVGVYVDGVYIARARGLNSAFFDVDRIEVLKGPQGTLYGRNTTGGAISIITKSADYNGIHGYVGADAGDYKLRAGRLAVNIPIIDDKLAVRLAYQRTLRQGFGQSAITGQHIGQDRNQNLFRASVRFDPAPNFNIALKADIYRSNENGNLSVPLYVLPTTPRPNAVNEAAVELFGTPGCASFATCLSSAALPAAQTAAYNYINDLTAKGRSDPYTNYTDHIQVDKNRVNTFGGTMTWDAAENVQIKSITGYRTFHTYDYFDLDGLPFDILEIGVGSGGTIPLTTGKPGGLSSNFNEPVPQEENNSFFSQEFNISGKTLGGRLTWLGGVYYSNEAGSDEQQARVTPALVPIVIDNDAEKVINKSWSLYSQNDFRITDTVSVTVGGRYTDERKGLVSLNANFSPTTGLYSCTSGALGANGLALVATSLTGCRTRSEKNFEGYSYLASVNWKITPDALLYLRTAKGFRGGAFQLRAPLLPPAGPETAKDIELGLKSEWFDRRLRANLAAYRTKYGNKQESVFFALPSGAVTTVLQNAANATIKGFEAEVTAVPVEGLTLNGTLNYIHGRYDRFPNALPINGGPAVNATGERFGLPPWSYTLSARYEIPVLSGNLGLQADWSYVSSARPPPRLVNPLIPNSILDMLTAGSSAVLGNARADLGLLNARIDYALPQKGVSVSLFMTNVMDKKYLFPSNDPSGNGGLVLGIPGEPRMYGISLRKAFGGE